MRFVPDLSWLEVLARISVAGALGGAVGLERELRERAAGLRTHLLVAVGSAVFTLVSAYAWRDFHFSNREGVTFDPTRIAAQVVSGIGFLGAGAIIRQGISIRGLTTAATLWVVAAIGMAAGAGYYSAAVLGTALVLVSLWPLRLLGFQLSNRIRPLRHRLIVEVPRGASAAPVLTALEGVGAQTMSLEFDEERDRRRVAVEVELPRDAERIAVVARLMEQEGVVGAEWAE
jgi:putative Mg2+ transporter-C (MgtC) family protein